MLQKVVRKSNAVPYGIFSGTGLLIFYLTVVSLFQGISFAFLNLRSLWYLFFPLSIGFGTQVGLFISIRHTAQMTGTIVGTGTISGGSMIACCSHFLLQMIPFLGLSGLAVFLMKYQTTFLGVGIASNIMGIGLMLRHKGRMNFTKIRNLKGGCCSNE